MRRTLLMSNQALMQTSRLGGKHLRLLRMSLQVSLDGKAVRQMNGGHGKQEERQTLN